MPNRLVLTARYVFLALLALVLLWLFASCDVSTPPGNPPKASRVPDIFVDSARGIACYTFDASGYVDGRTVSCVKYQ